MLYWIFDLDETLYDLYGREFSYNILEKDTHLDMTLNSLPCKKIIFTNGTYGHAINCLNRLQILNNFDNIIARDTIKDLKPRDSSFIKFIRKSKINYKDLCVFFEDSLINLEKAKQFGWITVYISKNQLENDSYIPDFQFPNIQIALNFFIYHIHR